MADLVSHWLPARVAWAKRGMAPSFFEGGLPKLTSKPDLLLDLPTFEEDREALDEAAKTPRPSFFRYSFSNDDVAVAPNWCLHHYGSTRFLEYMIRVQWGTSLLEEEKGFYNAGSPKQHAGEKGNQELALRTMARAPSRSWPDASWTWQGSDRSYSESRKKIGLRLAGGATCGVFSGGFLR
ncbi:unnamed protein product [Effrenium voratum]|nr:unnamed protein product [Effrenium voratum]